MDKDFVELVKKIVNEKGKNILTNSKLTKALFLDYSHGEYKNEINLLVKIIELGYSNRIQTADDLDTIKLILSRQLNENYYIVEDIAVQIVSLLIALLKDINYLNKTNNKLIEKNIIRKREDKEIIDKPFENKQQKKIIVKNDIEIDDKWICSKCGNENDIYLSNCNKCGKEFYNNKYNC
jgi:ribosomal protein L40E